MPDDTTPCSNLHCRLTLLLFCSLLDPASKIPVKWVPASVSITLDPRAESACIQQAHVFFAGGQTALAVLGHLHLPMPMECSGTGRHRAEIQVWIYFILALHPQGLRVDAGLLIQMAQRIREEWERRTERELGEKKSKGGRDRLSMMVWSSTFLEKADLLSKWQCKSGENQSWFCLGSHVNTVGTVAAALGWSIYTRMKNPHVCLYGIFPITLTHHLPSIFLLMF